MAWSQSIESGARALTALSPHLATLDARRPEIEDCLAAEERGYFRPDEDERVLSILARYTAVRAALHEIIADLEPAVRARLVSRQEDDREFAASVLVAHTAACLLVRTASILVAMFADRPHCRAKLDQGEPRFGLPRKQFTDIYRSYTDPRNAVRLMEANRLADQFAAEIQSLSSDPLLQPVVQIWSANRDSTIIGVRQTLWRRLAYRAFSLRRRTRSARHQALFAMMELGGRLAARLRNPWHQSCVDDTLRRRLIELLRPGDVVVTRHRHVASNYFLPGYWPHAALYLGTPDQIASSLDEPARRRIQSARDAAPAGAPPIRFLEGLKDGIRLRPAERTLCVDACAVIRPRLSETDIALGLSRALSHEGKPFDFDFDFTRSDRLVCTEVVYRGFDGVGGLRFELTRRMGRLTFSAEDLLDLGVDQRGYEPIALFSPDHGSELVTGPDLTARLAATYRADR